MKEGLEELKAACVAWGQDPLLVQGAGGNVSLKHAHTMSVKASGFSLKNAKSQNIFVEVDRAPVAAAIDRGDFGVEISPCSGELHRPSIETILHVLMPQKYVAHLHAIEALARLVRPHGGGALHLCRSAGLRVTEVPYKKPGGDLASAVHEKLLTENKKIDVVLLRNHGLLVGAESVSALATIVDKVCSTCSTEAFYSKAPRWLESNNQLPVGWKPIGDPRLHELCTVPHLFRRLRSSWRLYPDHVVFLGESASRASTLDELFHSDRSYVCVRNKGVFTNDKFTTAELEQLQAYYEVITRQTPDQKLTQLTLRSTLALTQWEAETYRQNRAL